MTTITLFRMEPLLNKDDLINRLNDVKANGCWLKAKESKYNENEIEIDVWYEEDVEIGLRRAFSEEAYEMVDYFRNNGREKIIRKVYCFADLELGLLEIYRGIDPIVYKIKEVLEKLLEVNLVSISLDSGHLMHIVAKYSSELKQAMLNVLNINIYKNRVKKPSFLIVAL